MDLQVLSRLVVLSKELTPNVLFRLLWKHSRLSSTKTGPLLKAIPSEARSDGPTPTAERAVTFLVGSQLVLSGCFSTDPAIVLLLGLQCIYRILSRKGPCVNFTLYGHAKVTSSGLFLDRFTSQVIGKLSSLRPCSVGKIFAAPNTSPETPLARPGF